MPLTTEQQTTLRNAILADPVLAALTPSADNAFAIAEAYKVISTPAFIVWRSNVTADEIGNAWIGTDIDAMSALNMQRLQLLLASSLQGVFDMRRVDRRAGFENPFGTNQNNASRQAMRAVWKRSANRLEKLFATGTGSDAVPATMVVEGSIPYQEIQQIMGTGW
jgi:hypothetical protein